MLTRRNFSACAICAITGFAATAVGEANAQAPAGLKRTILSKTEYPDSEYATILVTVDIEAGAIVPRHTHPEVNPPMWWRASSSFRSKVSPRGRSRPATVFRCRPRCRTAAATVTNRPSSS